MHRHLREGVENEEKKVAHRRRVISGDCRGSRNFYLFFFLHNAQYSIASRDFNKEINVQEKKEKNLLASSVTFMNLIFPWDSDETIQDTRKDDDDDDRTLWARRLEN